MNEDEQVFSHVCKMMRELIHMRRQVISGTLPADELARTSHQIADRVDYGNRLLELDLSIRSEDTCTPADVRTLSAVEVFKMVSCCIYISPKPLNGLLCRYFKQCCKSNVAIMDEQLKCVCQVHNNK